MYSSMVPSLSVLNLMVVAVKKVTGMDLPRKAGPRIEKPGPNVLEEYLRSGIYRSPQRRHHLFHLNTTVMNYITEEWNQIMVMLSLQVVQN